MTYSVQDSGFPILIDCDGILSDFTASCLRLAREQAGIYCLEEDVTEWDTAKAIGWPRLNCAVTDAIRNSEMCYRLPEYPNAIAWLRDVEATFGADRVYVCTSPWNGEWMAQRAAWLELRGVPLKRQIQMANKALIPGYLVDDAPHNQDPTGRFSFMISRPWNKSYVGLAARGDYSAAMAWLKDTIPA